MNTDPAAQVRPVVLLVDDEAEILVALTDLLEDTFTVLSTTSPTEALEILSTRNDVDVIVSDQRMPEMGGDVMLARARAHSDAQAILLTGYADIGAVAAALNQGRISFYSHKPWDPDALRAMIVQAADYHRLERELRTERMLLHGLLDNLRSGLGFKDAQGRFIRINQQAADFYGRDINACLGRTEEELCDADLLPIVRAASARLRAEGRDEEALELPAHIRGAAQGRWREITRVVLGALGDGSAGSVVINRDITRQQEMAARLRQAEKMQALGTLAGGIAHDFNNLLTAVLGSLELVRDMGPEEGPMARLLDNAAAAAQRGASLTRRLLNFSRPRDLSLEPVDVNALLHGMKDLLAQTVVSRQGKGANGQPCSIVVDTAASDGALPPVCTDAGQLELAVLNLCINAVDAMPGGGMIVVSTALKQVKEIVAGTNLVPGNYVMVSVTDQGVGMSPDTLARVFEPFFTTKDMGRGTGLGLSMIYGFIRHVGGEVQVRSQPGEGTRVDLCLPVQGGGGVGERSLPARLPQAKAGGSSARALHVMVVDDEPGVRAVTVGFLRARGHEVCEYSSGTAAVQAMKEGLGPIDLVIMDVMMPGMGGLETVHHLQALRPGLRVLYLTGYASAGALPAGSANVMHKPFTQADLAAHIDRIMQRPSD
ncbi:hybrid sensor histidine kinase/response regulator [Komagataeibacter nataicola]|uniref:histidine kinase n=1 Tax=Komagataeibacter nataicola TaxID=265960 RepID=A0A9N7CD63_9PROT|nr:response regulator [Komagataeibacter nataicola]AQU88882.1 hybrid sensor histidine kinase/response regulator [Komagataeibacter nataicola]PYD68029.1 hybrid sensor histidine kinase/response regulator [Komagataeibacter nataicola]WEQ57226.1 response regulator [Komagataeibacter nataicola]